LTVGVTDGSATAAVRAAGATAHRVAHSAGHLDRVKAQLDARRAGAPRAVAGWYVDLPTNSVVVLARPEQVPAARRFVAAAAGAAAARVVASAEQPRPTPDLKGGDPFYAGAARCTVGFTVRGGFVTAGHCYSADSPPLTGPNGQPLGEWGGASFPGNDYAWVRTYENWTLLPLVGDMRVGGSVEATVGASVCRLGRTTGVRCGVIQAKNQTVNYPEGTVLGLTRTNVCGEPGDSGGPFISGVQAQGIASGASGNCTSGGTTYFQPVNEILSAFGLTLLTAPSG
jgi:streptogrisin C